MNIKKISAIIAGLSLCMCLASCGDSDSSTRDASSTADTANSSQANDSTGDSDASSTEEYDPNGDVRVFDSLKEQFAGNYKLTAKLSVNDGEAYPVVYEVKGDLRYISATISGMMTERFVTEDGDLYVINQGATTYEKYGSAELGNQMLKSPQYDPLFAATGEFRSASVDGGVITEVYAIDFDGIAGTISYSFDETSRALTGVKIDSGDIDNETVTDIVVSAAEDGDFTMPDISGYTRNN